MARRSQETARVESSELKEIQVPTDRTTQEILFRLQKENTHAGRLAREIWESMRRQVPGWGTEPPEHFSISIPQEENFDPELEWNALQYEIENERVRMGEVTPRVEAFLESRNQLNESLRAMRKQLAWEHRKVNSGMILEREKDESSLYKEVDEIVQDLAREMGFEGRMRLEITRDSSLNASVLIVSKEGGREPDITSPIHVFVNAGLINQLEALLVKDGKTLTKDHIAGVLGHEIAHLKQPAWHEDAPRMDGETVQRHEYDADSESMVAMDRAGYNPRAMIEVFEVFSKYTSSANAAFGHYVFGTHPIAENRKKEAWKALQRPGKPFFSSQKEMEPVSDGILWEAKQLVREDLFEQMHNVKRLEDWNSILARLEQDPTMTIRDIEIVGREIKLYMDAQHALSVVAEELATDTGLAEALLYGANALYKKLEQEPDNKIELFHGIFGSMHSNDPYITLHRMASDIIDTHSSEELRREFRPEFQQPEEEQKIISFVERHLANEVVTADYFVTIDDLFDPKNERAVQFWRAEFELNQRDIPKNADSETVIRCARKRTMMRMASALYGGIDKRVGYYGDRLDEKERFLEALKEIQRETEDAATTGDEDVSMAFDLDRLKALKTRVQDRVAVYKKQEPVGGRNKSEAYKTPRERSFHLDTDSMEHPLDLPEEAFASGSVCPTDATPLQKTMFRYFQAARVVFDKSLSPEYLQQEFGITTDDDPRARDVLFRDLFEDFFYKTQESASGGRLSKLDFESLEGMPSLFAYGRIVSKTPSSLLEAGIGNNNTARDYFRRNSGYDPALGIIFKFFINNIEAASSNLEEFGKHIEKIRTIGLRPGLLWHSSLDGRYIADKRVQEVVSRVDDLFVVKQKLFQNFVRAGVFSGEKSVHEDIRELLAARAEANGLPRDFFMDWKFSDFRTRLDRLMRKPEIISREDKDRLVAETDEIFSEEFMRLFADDAREMSKCYPRIINVLEKSGV